LLVNDFRLFFMLKTNENKRWQLFF